MIYEVGNCEIENEIDTVVQSLYQVTWELHGCNPEFLKAPQQRDTLSTSLYLMSTDRRSKMTAV